MISARDILHLPYTPDLTAGGITCTCHSLAFNSNRKKNWKAETLRHMVAGMVVELAFHRYLSAQGIPFHLLETAPFSRTDRYDLSLGGHRCELKHFLITRREQIIQLRKSPGLALQVPALVPIQEIADQGRKPDDLYIFALLLGIVTPSWDEVDKAAAAGQPISLVHLLPREWCCPADWLPMEKLVLKNEDKNPVRVEIGGQNALREFITSALELAPGTLAHTDQIFHSLAYVQTDSRPGARIGLHSPSRGAAYIIPHHAWTNIWVYGMDIVLMGWLSREEYQRKSKVLNAGMQPFLHEPTKEKNLLVPMQELNPLGPLFSRVRAWAGSSNKS